MRYTEYFRQFISKRSYVEFQIIQLGEIYYFKFGFVSSNSKKITIKNIFGRNKAGFRLIAYKFWKQIYSANVHHLKPHSSKIT